MGKIPGKIFGMANGLLGDVTGNCGSRVPRVLARHSPRGALPTVLCVTGSLGAVRGIAERWRWTASPVRGDLPGLLVLGGS